MDINFTYNIINPYQIRHEYTYQALLGITLSVKSCRVKVCSHRTKENAKAKIFFNVLNFSLIFPIVRDLYLFRVRFCSVWTGLKGSFILDEIKNESDVALNQLHCSKLCVYTRRSFFFS